MLTDIWSGENFSVSSIQMPEDGSLTQCGAPLSEWKRFGLAHLACHGHFDVSSPFDAALFLGSERILAGEFFATRLNLRLVGLNACDVGGRTGRVDEIDSAFDEWLGLYLPLFYAGAQMVVASRWQADSQKALQFMAVFHAALAGGDTPAIAMRSACAK